MRARADIAIVGGGIVGLATALALVEARRTVVVLEAEDRLAAHQSGHNSGVIHSGLYYKPGSLKARLCREGREAMYAFCAAEGIPHRRVGKLVVATRAEQLEALDRLEARGRANGLQGLRRLRREELRELEPEVAGVAGLWVAETGVVDYAQVAAAFARLVERGGGEIRTNARVLGAQENGSGLRVETTVGDVQVALLVNCAGLQADRVARACGVDPGAMIVPFRGEYYELVAERRSLVKHLIYPVPNPALPFLGVHFTRRIDGRVDLGPNAVLAFKREGYRRSDVSPRDIGAMLGFGGFWRMAARYWRTGLAEWRRSLSRRLFVQALQELVPALREADVQPLGSGVRAQAIDRTGTLLDDFHIVQSRRSIHVLNAPSPAATASISIGRHIAQVVSERLNG
jgi:L-2-hydroxyglutarate oxidase